MVATTNKCVSLSVGARTLPTILSEHHCSSVGEGVSRWRVGHTEVRKHHAGRCVQRSGCSDEFYSRFSEILMCVKVDACSKPDAKQQLQQTDDREVAEA